MILPHPDRQARFKSKKMKRGRGVVLSITPVTPSVLPVTVGHALPEPSIPPATPTSLPRFPPPLPIAKSLNLRTKKENQTAANIMKQLLDDDKGDELAQVPPEEATLDLAGHANTATSAATAFPPRPYYLPSNPNGLSYMEGKFHDEYRVPLKALRSLEHFGNGDQEELWKSQSNHLLLGQTVKDHQPLASSDDQMPSSDLSEAEDLDLEIPEDFSMHDEVAAMDTPEETHRATQLFVSDAGCDIPMPRADEGDYVPRVCLDPDLPPMAVEHPARVWNSMLHALSAELQPLIRWAYDEVEINAIGDMGFLAHLTLILSPSHPAVSSHPLSKFLPKNRYEKEYLVVMEALGGIKTWTGSPRRLKADAQNTTLTTCIAENALAWVHAPMMAAVPEDEDAPPLPPHKPFPVLLQPGVEVEGGMENMPGKATLVKALAAFPADSHVSILIEFDQNEDTGLYGSSLLVGVEPEVQRYIEPCYHVTTEAAQEAACQRALNLNVVEFLVWLGAGAVEEDGDSNSAPHQVVKAPTDSELTTRANGTSDTVDWQKQLDYFCQQSGLTAPKYSQTMVKRNGQPTLFIGLVSVDDEKFETKTTHPSLKDARQAVAFEVFRDHFGQEPEAML